MASTINASNSGFGGIVSTGDSSGELALQAAGTTVATLTSSGMTVVGTPVVAGQNLTPYTMKNRIINGAMVIDQRNAGASVATTTVSGFVYTLDRWNYYGDASSKFTVQQNAGSVTPPAGFSNYLGITSTSAYTVGASDVFSVAQFIEGFNTADLAWGTANAKAITISFWVRSSLTGTFGGSILNSAANRSYPFSYTISAANTWEQKTITIAGDTTGTWLTTNGIGIKVFFGLGAGSTYSGTAGSWAATQYYSATGATSVVGTNAATWYVTGVQLEVGSYATPFEWRPYGTELSLCQRYYQVLPAGGVAFSTTACLQTAQPYVPLRPGSVTATYSGTLRNSSTGSGITWTGTVVFQQTTASGTNVQFFYGTPTPALSAGNSYDGGSGAVITVNAEL